MEFKEDKSKTLRQEESINKWRNAKGNGTLLLCPRFGKTKIGVEIVKRTIEKNNNAFIIILAPSEYIVKYWKNYFDDNFLATYQINIYSIDYFIKNSNTITYNQDLVIVDEVHKFLSDKRYEVLKELRSKSKWWLNLLGIMPHEKDRDMICALAPVIDKITTQEAVEKGWVSPHIEYNICLEFSDEDRIRYIKLSSLIKDTLDIFKDVHRKVKYQNKELFQSDFELIYACYAGKKLSHGFVEGKKIREITANIMGWNTNLDLYTEYGRQRDKYWNPNNIYERCKSFSINVKLRNNIISNNNIKLDMINNLITKYPVPTIIFNESIDFVTKIADSLGKDAIAYHSQIESRPIWDNDNNDWFRYASGKKQGQPKMFGKDKIKEETIQGIINGKYKYLVTAKALDEGLTIPNLEQVIITAGSTNLIQQGQRKGRGTNIDINNPNKQTKIFNLYFNDIYLVDGGIIRSRDKTKLLERQTNSAIEISNLDEIS